MPKSRFDWPNSFGDSDCRQESNGKELISNGLKRFIINKVFQVEKLSGYDDTLVDYILNENLESYETIPVDVLQQSARRVCINNPGRAALVLIGSSYKNIAVQPLMDAIARYFWTF